MTPKRRHEAIAIKQLRSVRYKSPLSTNVHFDSRLRSVASAPGTLNSVCGAKPFFTVAASNRARENTGAMRFRATLASLLTVFLLSFLFFASSCETRCDLESLAGSCHGAPQHAEQGAMPAMAGMMVHAVAERVTAANPAFTAGAAACAHHVCAQPPVAVNDQKAALINAPLAIGLRAFDSLLISSDPALALSSVRGPPLYRRATPVALHTTLLI